MIAVLPNYDCRLLQVITKIFSPFWEVCKQKKAENRFKRIPVYSLVVVREFTTTQLLLLTVKSYLLFLPTSRIETMPITALKIFVQTVNNLNVVEYNATGSPA
jgi:hypothetical protein